MKQMTNHTATIAAAVTLAGLFLTIYGASHLMIWLSGVQL